jgi:hypothetical protein
LGSGGQGRTFEAWDHHAGQLVAAKEMSLASARDWKSVELFRRAAETLQRLHHPGIPRLVESFAEERGGVTFYYVVQERIDGETLAEALRRGERFDETAAREIAEQVLAVLSYLHAQSPPIIHRDLKPSNLMRREDGSLVLIDFDLVRSVSRPEGGSTMAAGTSGFAPLEQYFGMPVPASDLYALGATLVALLSRLEPADLMPPGEHRVDFEGQVAVSDGFAGVLAHLLEPEVSRRYQAAAEVLTDLAQGGRPGEGRRRRRRGGWLAPGCRRIVRGLRSGLRWIGPVVASVLVGGQSNEKGRGRRLVRSLRWGVVAAAVLTAGITAWFWPFLFGLPDANWASWMWLLPGLAVAGWGCVRGGVPLLTLAAAVAFSAGAVYLVNRSMPALPYGGSSGARLREVPPGIWAPLPTRGLAGGTVHFDPVGSLPWIESVAQAWGADARLLGVAVTGAGHNGVVETGCLSCGWNRVRYRFFSPSRWEEGRRDRSAAGCLELAVQGKAVRFSRVVCPPPAPGSTGRPPRPTCSLATVAARLRQAGLLSGETLSASWDHRGAWRVGELAAAAPRALVDGESCVVTTVPQAGW